MMDWIEDNRGPTAADQALSLVSRVFSWHASRSDDFNSPIVRGMARTSPTERVRQRVLTDDELRSVCKAGTVGGPYGALVRFLLLTGARRNEACEMPRSEVANGIWTIPASRYKTGNERPTEALEDQVSCWPSFRLK